MATITTLESPPPPPETDSECDIAFAQLRTRHKAHHDQKPILIFICPKGIRFWARFRSVLLKIQRDARIMYAINLAALDTLLSTHRPDIAGFIVTDPKIMDPEHDALSQRLATLLTRPDPPSPPAWSVIFAFDFPSGAARRPMAFARYMSRHFSLPWKITGKTVSKIKLRLRPQTLRKMGPRRYRLRFHLRSVFLRAVKMADKLLLATGEFGPGGQPDDECLGALLRPDCETSTTTEGDIELVSSGVVADSDDDDENHVPCQHGHNTSPTSTATTPTTTVGGERGGNPVWRAATTAGCDSEDEWADDELENDDDDDDDDDDETIVGYSSLDQASRAGTDHAEHGSTTESVASDWVPSDDEGTAADMQVADSPVAIHEVKSWVEHGAGNEAVLVRGYVGFVGHVEDNRSTSSLILGMCAVGAFVPPS